MWSTRSRSGIIVANTTLTFSPYSEPTATGCGWSRAAWRLDPTKQVVLFDQAINFYTKEIETNPGNSWHGPSVG